MLLLFFSINISFRVQKLLYSASLGQKLDQHTLSFCFVGLSMGLGGGGVKCLRFQVTALLFLLRCVVNLVRCIKILAKASVSFSCLFPVD